MIKAIIFDIGGVIYVGKQKSNQSMQEKLGLDKDSWFKATREAWNNLVVGKISEKKGISQMAKNLGVSEKRVRELWLQTFKERFVLNKPILKIIKKLKKDYKLAILSDQWIMPYRILITKEIKKMFEVKVFSHQVKTKKPEIKIYKITLKKLGLKSDECIIIDDVKHYLDSAKKLGMKTILFKNNKQLVKDLRKFGVKLD